MPTTQIVSRTRPNPRNKRRIHKDLDHLNQVDYHKESLRRLHQRFPEYNALYCWHKSRGEPHLYPKIRDNKLIYNGGHKVNHRGPRQLKPASTGTGQESSRRAASTEAV